MLEPLAEPQLAWDLAEALRDYLSSEECAAVFVELGSDDFSAVIHRLLRIAVARDLSVPIATFERLHLWSRVYDRESEYVAILTRLHWTTPLSS